MLKTLKIAKQEFKMVAANKAFVITTLLGPLFILAITVVPILLAGNDQEIARGTLVSVLGAEQTLVNELNARLGPDAQLELSYETTSPASLQEDVKAERIQGYLLFQGTYPDNPQITYYSKTGTDLLIFNSLRSLLAGHITTTRIQAAGIDPELVARLSVLPPIEIQKIVAAGNEDKATDYGSIFMTALSFVMLIYMTVLLYGQMIGRAVVKEKISKTVEIMLSSVTPRQMMFGKILGIGFAGIVQYLFWILMVLIAFTFIGPVLGIATPVTLNLGNLGFMLIYFLIAYFIYSAAYAAIGSAAEDEQHMGQLGMPLILFLILPMVMISSILQNPSSTLVVVMSFFPLTSPLVMFLRIMLDTPPVWEIALSLGIALLTILLIVYAAARIFRVGILMTGKRFKLGEILKWVGTK